MQLFALIALLPLFAAGAPLQLGNVQVLPQVQNPKVPAIPAIPAVPAVPTTPKVPTTPGQVGTTLGSVLALGSDGNGVLGAAVQGAGKAPATVVATVGGIASNATASVNVTLTNGLGAVGNDNVIVKAGQDATGKINGTLGGAVQPITAGTPVELLQRLSGYIAGIKAPSIADAITQLTITRASLELALKNEIQSIKDNVEISQIISYTVQLVKNLNQYLLDASVSAGAASDAQLAALALAVDTLLAQYIFALQTIGISTNNFLEAAYSQGLTSSAGFSTLLPKISAIFPPAPSGPKITAGL